MKVVCAWCKKELGEKPPYDDRSTTHGMCETCRQTAAFEKLIKQLPGRFDVVRNTERELTEVLDKDKNILWQKTKSGWEHTEW